MPPAPPAFEPMPEPMPESSPVIVKRGFAGRLGAGLVGLVVLGGGLAYAVSQAGAGGGASSPEGAAQELFDAIAAEDLLGALDVLPSGERRAFQGSLESMADELGRLGVVGDDLDLGAVGGLDLEFEDLTFESNELGDGIASVRLTGGTAITSVKPDELPIGDQLRDVIDDITGEPLEIEPVEEERDTLEPGDGDFEVVAVEEDGTWRISLFYSIAEAARRSAGLDAPDFGAGIAPAGADSPEAAVEALVRAAAEEQDLARVVALLPPDEMGALQDYAPLFLDDAQSAIDAETESLEVEITDLSLDAEEDGDTASVVVAGFAVDASFDGEAVSASFDGECVTVEGPDGEVEEQCTGDLGDLGPLADVLNLDDAAVAGVSTVEVDGRWYVSPTRTMLDSVVGLLASLDDDAISKLPMMGGGLFGMSEALFDESSFGVVDDVVDGMSEDVDLDGLDDLDEAVATTSLPFQPPSVEMITRMLVDVLGYTEAQSTCIAPKVFAAGLTDEQLSNLQSGELPSEILEQVLDIVDGCLAAG